MDWPNLDDDFRYRTQKRPWSKKKYIRSKIASLDTETQAGDIQTLHTASLGKTENQDRTATFNHREKRVPFSFSVLFAHIIRNHSWETRKNKKKKYWTLPHFFAWNLGFDGDVMMKTLPWPTLESFSRSSKQVIDLETGWIATGVKKVRNRWQMEDGSKVPKNKYASFFYIRKKCLIIEPLFHYIKGRKVTSFHLYDVAQLYKERRLQDASLTYLGEGKDDLNTPLMGEGGEKSDQYWEQNIEDILKYGEKDALLTARLAWIRLNEYQEAGVCVFKPLSKASIARNNLFRLAEQNEKSFPSLDDYMKNPLNRHIVLAALSSYGGGWFEMRGAGSINNVVGVDLVSAYPHVMNFLPDIRQLSWITDRVVGAEGILEYLKTHRLYWPAFVYASMKFPPGLPFYPMATWNDDYGTVQNPRNVTRWFTADEVVEAQKWKADIEIFHGAYSIVESADRIEVEEDKQPPQGIEDGVNYPFRVALETFYGGKAEIDLIPEEDRTETEHSAREVYKIMINSLYGLCLCTINDDGVEATGSMWNPIYASLITAGCRMRIAQIMRLNNHSVISVATDGVVLPSNQVLNIPSNPLPISGWTLGNWEIEAEGDFFAIGSGVYSIIGKSGKTTVRGHASRFINPKKENWREWCEEHGRQESVKMTFKAPYSMGEARVRSNFELVGQFREQTATMRPTMDANKRPRWEDIPEKFEDLVNGWFVSYPPEYLTRKVR